MTRTPAQVAAATAHTRKGTVCQTAPAHKGKTEVGKGRDAVQVASMFPGVKSSHSVKGAVPAGKACKPQAEIHAKGHPEASQEKGQDQSSCARAGHKTAQSRGSPARVASTAKKSDPHRKSKPMQTAYKPKGCDS